MSGLAHKVDFPTEKIVAKPVLQDRVGRVDTIRFLCALAVMFSHTPMPYFDNLEQPYKLLLTPINWSLMNGPAAVVIFFVISGFSIHWPYRNGKALAAPRFALSRLTRICLPWLGAIGVNEIFGCPQIVPRVMVYWSLFAEAIYYLTYPLVLLMMRRFGWTPLFVLSWVGSLLVFGLWNRTELTVHASGIGVTWLLAWPSWLLGLRLANDLNSPLIPSKAKLNLLRLAILVAAYATLVLNFHTPFRVGLSLNFFAVLAYFWLRRELHSANDSWIYDWLEGAGKWSYSLYLVHIPVRYWVVQMGLGVFPTYLASIFGGVLVAYLFYRMVEKPTHALSRHLSRGKSSPLTPRESPPNA